MAKAGGKIRVWDSKNGSAKAPFNLQIQLPIGEDVAVMPIPPHLRGSSFEATQRERQQGRDTGCVLRRTVQGPQHSPYTPKAAFWGATAGQRAEDMTARLVEGWARAGMTPGPAGTVLMTTLARPPVSPRCRELTPGGQPTLSPILSLPSSRHCHETVKGF